MGNGTGMPTDMNGYPINQTNQTGPQPTPFPEQSMPPNDNNQTFYNNESMSPSPTPSSNLSG